MVSDNKRNEFKAQVVKVRDAGSTTNAVASILGQSKGREEEKRKISVKHIKNHKFYTSFYFKTSKISKFRGASPPELPHLEFEC